MICVQLFLIVPISDNDFFLIFSHRYFESCRLWKICIYNTKIITFCLLNSKHLLLFITFSTQLYTWHEATVINNILVILIWFSIDVLILFIIAQKRSQTSTRTTRATKAQKTAKQKRTIPNNDYSDENHEDEVLKSESWKSYFIINFITITRLKYFHFFKKILYNRTKKISNYKNKSKKKWNHSRCLLY